ncbi:MarR family winged helix-turn-helix transcriptional regulator [Pseudaestuariivita atlantica]|uniref:MarR family winged helix-turn-helix transcriptional regulator n=1 Tax=Pseudaestuariivita atlantica TaxID=1317121 RepID=UPI00067C0935|nr:MarR family winged helix-turn-helix transcriptional regulator [Pseudaestuariivita atlantica]
MSDTPSKLDTMLCYRVYALQLAFNRYYQAVFGDTGFTYPKYVALMGLDELGTVTLNELAARIGVEPNTLSPLVKKMSGFGLIDRKRDDRDERRVLLSLTPFGRSVLAEATRAADAGWESLGLDPAAVEQALAVLGDANDRLAAADLPTVMRLPDRPGD